MVINNQAADAVKKIKYWEGILAELKTSGLTKTFFCKQRGIANSSLHKWCKRLSKNTLKVTPDPVFLPLKVKQEKIDLDSSLVLLLKNDIRLVIPENVNKVTLKVFLEVLGVLPC